MTQNKILQRIDLFRHQIQHLVTTLKAIQHKQFWKQKTTPDILSEVAEVHLLFRTYSEDILNRQGFIDLPVTSQFCETSDTIENLWEQSQRALDDAQEGKDSNWLDVWLIDAINRLSALCDGLSDFLKNERNTPAQTAKEPGETKPEDKAQLGTKEPSKEAKQAYKLYHGCEITQTEVAEKMTDILKKPVNQGQVSRWINEYKSWRKAVNIPVDDSKPKIITNTDVLDMGARTDGRTTGDPRHRRKQIADYGDNHNQ